MFKTRKSKMFKLIAMVMAVAMLASAMMVQAFATETGDVSSISEKFYGQPVYAETYYKGNQVFRGVTTYGVVAGISMTIHGLFFGEDGLETIQNSNHIDIASYDAYVDVGSSHYLFPYALEGYTYHQVTYDGVSWGANYSKCTRTMA